MTIGNLIILIIGGFTITLEFKRLGYTQTVIRIDNNVKLLFSNTTNTHKKMRISIFILQIFVLPLPGFKAKKFENRKRPYIIALVSKCEGNNTMATDAGYILELFDSLSPFNIHIEDVCESEKDLIEFLLSLTLTAGWYNSDMKPENWKVHVIISLMPDHMLKMLVQFVAFSNITVYSLTKTSDDRWFENQKNFQPIYNTDLVVESIINRLVLQYKWRNSLIIEVTNSNPKINIESLLQSLGVKWSKCIRYVAVNSTKAFRKLIPNLKKNTELKVIFLINQQGGLLLNISHGMGLRNKFWVIFSNFKGHKKLKGKLLVFSNTKHGEDILQVPYFHNNKKCSQNLNEREHFKDERKPCKQKNSKKYNKNIMLKNYNSLAQVVSLLNNPDALKIVIFQKTKQIHSFYDIFETKSLRQSKNSKCPSAAATIDNCDSIYITTIKYTNFTKQIDFSCEKCKQPYTTDSTGQCKKCPDKMKAFTNGTLGCYDPIILPTIYKITYVLNAFGIALCLFIIGIFVRYRKTPVVRSSHYILSITQIIFCLLLFIVILIFVLSKPTVWLCTIRQPVISLLIIAIVSIVVCKAEKIITIYTMKTIMSSKDKLHLLIKQMFIFCFIIFIDCIIVAVCFPFPNYPVPITAYNNQGNVYQFQHCQLGMHSGIQAGYCVLLLALSIIQAYRGDKLPDAYNEGNAIITSSATSACCFLFLIIYTEKHGENNEDFISILWITICVSFIMLLLCLYGQKVYIIIFRSSTNTKAYLATYLKTMNRVEKFLNERAQKGNRRRLTISQKRRLWSIMQDTSTECELESSGVSLVNGNKIDSQ